MAQLVARLKTTFSSMSYLNIIESDFPLSHDSFWRSFIIDFPPRASEVKIVNTRTIATEPIDSGVVIFADLSRTTEIPGLPLNGCGMEDALKDVSVPLQHDTILLVTPLSGETNEAAVKYKVLFENTGAIFNNETPACCAEVVEGGEWSVTGRAEKLNEYEYTCSFSQGGVVSMFFYDENLFNMSKDEFEIAVYFMTEQDLLDFFEEIKTTLF